MLHTTRLSASLVAVLSLAAVLSVVQRPAAAVQLFRYDFDSGTTNPSGVASGVTASPITAQNLSTTIFSNVYQTSNYGSAFDSAQYFEFTATAASGKSLDLTDLRFTPETPSQANAVTAYVRSSVDSFASNIYIRNIPSGSFFFNETIDLTGASYQDLPTITFRFYGTSASTSSVLYYDAINLNGIVVNAVPEPSTYAMALAGVACSGYSMWRRRGSRRRTKSELKFTRNRCQLVSLTIAALSIIAAGAASTTSAAVIVWGTPQTITGDSDVNTSGSLVYAYNVGPSPTVSSTVTVGGVAFQPFPIINFPATNSFTFGSVTISESPGLVFGYDVASTSGSYGLLSPAYRALLDGGGGAGLPDTVTVSLGGLSFGQQYLFQWWASNAADISFVSTVTGVATNSVTLDSNLTNAAGGLGQFVTGTFTADGATQNITFTGAANSPLINAFQIRAVPEPASYAMALAGIACGCYSMWRRKRA